MSERKPVPRKRETPCTVCGTPRAFVDGAWLREQRKAAGLTLREVARRLGYTASYVCDVELNRRYASADLTARYLGAVR